MPDAVHPDRQARQDPDLAVARTAKPHSTQRPCSTQIERTLSFSRPQNPRRWTTALVLAATAALYVPAGASAADFDGDGRSDLAVVRPSS
ncbi:MAG: FG-GAP repeat protein, partial [Actinobacteria bacterium]|nr:FG-GAP repeat protein [Actinomycetota bacterium]